MFESSAEARAAAHARWARAVNRSVETQPARDGLRKSIEAQVDPLGMMSAEDRAKAIRNAHTLHMLKMTNAATKARKAKAAARKAAQNKAV